MMKHLKLCLLASLVFAPTSARAWLASDIQANIKGQSMLEEESSAKLITLAEGQYIVFAHGTSTYKGDVAESHKLAKADAQTQISRLLGDTEVSGRSLHQSQQREGASTYQSLTLNQIDTSILMRSSVTRGYWVEGDCFHLITCIYLNTPIPNTHANLDEEFMDIQLDKDWIKVLEQHHHLWLGGVGLVSHPTDGKQYLITLVSAKKSQPAHLTDRVLVNIARKEFAEYINGIEFKAQTLLTSEKTQVIIGDQEEVKLSQQLKQSSSQQTKAEVQPLSPVGTLQYKTSERKFTLFAQAIDAL